MSTKWHNCTIAGEGLENNPDYCLAFFDASEGSYKKEAYTNAEGEEELDCCWTANERSILPPSLKNLVTVHTNGTM